VCGSVRSFVQLAWRLIGMLGSWVGPQEGHSKVMARAFRAIPGLETRLRDQGQVEEEAAAIAACGRSG
jgi:hypothetical protein